MEKMVVTEKKLIYQNQKTYEVDIPGDGVVDSPDKAKAIFKVLLENEPYEALWCLAVNSQNEWLGLYKIGEGTVNRSSVYPRRLLSFLLLETNATGIILCHNHPGGKPEPSRQDIQITETLKDLLKDIDVSVLDHLIFAYEGGWSSFREDGWIV